MQGSHLIADPGVRPVNFGRFGLTVCSRAKVKHCKLLGDCEIGFVDDGYGSTTGVGGEMSVSHLSIMGWGSHQDRR